ncbi:MAG: DNA translocase FtsK, partial [Verrucomicrobiota bacterium]
MYYLYKDIPTFNLQHMLSDVGIILTFSITACVSFLFLMEIELLTIGRKLKSSTVFLKNKLLKIISQKKAFPTIKSASEIENLLSKRSIAPPYLQTKPKERPEKEIKIRTMADIEPPKKKQPIEANLSKRQIALNAQCVVNGDYTTYQIPPASLLNHPKKVDQPLLKKELKKQAEVLQDTLMSFGIEAKVGEINCGPTITSFEVHPAIGVKVQKIKTLENDIALNLQAKSIRIIAPIPGKAAVGVEIPSIYPQEVSFKELLTQYQSHVRKMMVPLLLGKTVSGDSVISDLSKMPHCLIAGATGSGKSVCVNTLIMSILMNARPDEIKLVMIDPKKVELTPYTNLPHMLAPVITEPHGAYAALSWLVKEMQTRYDILKQLGVRNITAFNNRQINQELESSLNIPIPAKMYAIVAIIDEFADLMMASSSDLETPIARIAQMARAVGIHLILATQRPSREVITGLIKANFPTRIAFKVASRINSQIILDDVGAESLLGNGDMLFLPPGTSTLIRSQGVYISDEEINRVVSFICNQSPPNYLIESFDKMRFEDLSSEEGAESAPRDLLYEQALNLVIETGNASTTFLQRKLKIGYARAASLMDELESKKVI